MPNKTYMEDATLQGRKAEIDTKLVRVREMLDNQGLEAVVLKKHSNYSWMTAGGKSSVTISTDGGEIALVITKTEAFAIATVIETPRMREEEKLEELGFQIIETQWYEDTTLETIKSVVSNGSKIICDMSLGDLRVAGELINPLRYSLLDNEIARYQYLGDNLSAALESYITTVKPGMTEYEITGGLCNALWKHGIDQILFMVQADERAYKYRHGIPTANRLKKHLSISVNGRYKGLITTVTRMAHFGKTDPALTEQFRRTTEIECKSIAAIDIGKDDLEGYHTNRKAYAEAGFADMWQVHGQGGSQGYNNRDYMLTESSHRITVPNQCYCFNPVIDGTKAEDAFIITENGPLFITKPVTFPKLPMKIGSREYDMPGLLFVF